MTWSLVQLHQHIKSPFFMTTNDHHQNVLLHCWKPQTFYREPPFYNTQNDNFTLHYAYYYVTSQGCPENVKFQVSVPDPRELSYDTNK